MSTFRMVYEELPQRCEMCGTIAITRPYGLNREEICQECAKLDEAVTLIRANECVNMDDTYG